MEGVAVSARRRAAADFAAGDARDASRSSYHDYEGIALNPEEKARLQADLGDTRHLILRNHGLLTVGRNSADAFLSMFTLQRACEIQVLAQGNGAELIPHPADRARHRPRVLMKGDARRRHALVWPALLRKMDRLDPAFANEPRQGLALSVSDCPSSGLWINVGFVIRRDAPTLPRTTRPRIQGIPDPAAAARLILPAAIPLHTPAP